MAASERPAPRPGLRAFWIWLACIAAAAVVTARSTYVADLSAFLPSSPTPEQAVLLDQLRSGVGSRLVLIGIEGGSAETRAAASLRWARALRASGAFESVDNGDNAPYEAVGRFLFEHRYLLSPAVDAERFSAAGLRAGIDETVALLGTPAGTLVKPILLRDPTGETVRMTEALLGGHAPRSIGGAWASRSAERAVLLATTRAGGADLDGQQAALDLLQSSFAAYRAQGLSIVVSGAGTFAVASRAQIKREVERLAIAGSAAIVVLLLVAFGSARALVVALLPVASGVLAGIAAVSLGFGRVHGITLGFGTTLIGEAVDYAIYYLIQARPPGPAPEDVAESDAAERAAGARRWLVERWPTVRLGLLTSVCGFAALVFSGFPGLAQLGVFSIAGLTAAALTTRCVFPILAPDGAPGMGLRHRLGQATGALADALPRWRRPLLALPFAAALALALLPSPWRGDLSSLNPVGAAAIALDAELRRDVGADEAGLLIALAAPDEAGALAAAEAAGRRLDRLVAAGALEGYSSPARLLPSVATQLARRAALPAADELRARLAEATADGPLNANRLGGFIDDVQTARHQAPLTRASLQGTPLATAVDALLMPGAAGGPARALIRLQSGASPDVASPGGQKGLDADRLRAALADVPGARVVAISAELAALYARYLHEAALQALFGALAVCVLLGLRLRSWRRLRQIAQPVAAAVLIVLAGLAAVGAQLGILHLVGFLLVVAIGSNYALFFDQLRHVGNADTDTLASLALANLTAVISFGLLAFSTIPALCAIGQVVAPGTLLSLVLSAAFIPARRGEAYGKMPLPSP